MNPTLARHRLPDVVEKQLREAFVRGDYGRALPGERVLADTFKVSRPTIRRALATLSAEGLIRQSRGKPTVILDTARLGKPGEAAPRRVVFLSPHPLHRLSPGTMLGFDMLGEKLSHARLDLRFVACQAFLQRDFEHTLDGFIRSTPAEVYVLHQAPPAVQRRLASLRVPCVVMGSPDPIAGLPGVDTDFAPAARHAMGELKRLGHRTERILLALPEIELTGHTAMKEGFVDAGGAPASIIRHSGDFELLPAWISTRFLPLLRAKSPPSAIITGWPRFTVGLVSGLAMRHGLMIPETLSVACLADDPAFDMFIPQITHYRRPAEKYVDRLLKHILDTVKHRSHGKGGSELIVPEFVPGGTLAPPGGTEVRNKPLQKTP